MVIRHSWRAMRAIVILTAIGASGCLPGYEAGTADDGGSGSLADGTVPDVHQGNAADAQAHEGGRDSTSPGSDGASRSDGSAASGGGAAASGGGAQASDAGVQAAADAADGSNGMAEPDGSDSAVAAVPLGQGAACNVDGDCATGHCADGVCCDQACTGACQACNVAMFAGTCSAVARGQAAPGAPHAACAASPASTCGNDGKCDGLAHCEMWPNGTSCAAGSCSTATNQSAAGSACDGMGACKASSAVTCAPFKCNAAGAACATSCTMTADCVGQPCVSGSCGTVANGSRCTAASQCTSGNCVDGYCCNLACAGSCQACNIAGAEGTCSTVPAGAPHGLRTCAGAGVCQGACNGASASCVYPTTACAAQSCAGGAVSHAASCDGAGSCPTPTTSSCSGFACNGTSCFTKCTSDAQCTGTTPYCNASGACQATAPLGHACSAGTVCSTGSFCVDSVCCGSRSCPASDQCHAAGTCSPGTGTCTNPPLANGSACSDGNACTQADTCKNGACSGSTVSCAASDACHLAGACTASTGLCSNPVAPDGTSCGTGAVCVGGVCKAQYALKFKMVAFGSASQTVTSSPGGISCAGASCSVSANYNAGTVVTLRVAAGGSGLYHWSGACSGTAPTCSVTMTSAQPVTLTLNGNNYAFITSQTFSASMGGLAGADANCAAAAANAGLPGHYVALMSTSTTNANSRVGAARGWIRTDGLPVADDASSLFGRGKMFYPVDVDEFGKSSPGVTFTGSTDQGNVTVIEGVTPATCSDWTSAAASPNAGCGSAVAASLGWLGICGTTCSGAGALYCFGTDLATPVNVAGVSGRIAFLSTGTWDTASGVSTADALCRSEASGASLSGASSFIALLATNTASAASRLNAGGANWTRTDGLAIASSTSQFIAGTLAAPIVVAADGVTYAATIDPDASPMVGATSLSALGTDTTTCNGWTADTSPATGETGYAGYTFNDGAFAWTTRPCGAYHVYCIEP